MGELQDAVNLLQSMGPVFDPTDDFLNIVSAEEQMSSVAADRRRELDAKYAHLKSLTRTLEAARITCVRPPTIPSAEAHVETLNAQDAARLGFMKNINAAEGALAEKEGVLVRLRAECSSLKASDPASEHELDASTLKLTLIRGLGFSTVTDKNGRVQKVLIRAPSGEVHSITFDEDKSDMEYANLLWNLASS